MRFSTKITNVKSLIEGEMIIHKIINVNLNYKTFQYQKMLQNLSTNPNLHIKFH